MESNSREVLENKWSPRTDLFSPLLAIAWPCLTNHPSKPRSLTRCSPLFSRVYCTIRAQAFSTESRRGSLGGDAGGRFSHISTLETLAPKKARLSKNPKHVLPKAGWSRLTILSWTPLSLTDSVKSFVWLLHKPLLKDEILRTRLLVEIKYPMVVYENQIFAFLRCPKQKSHWPSLRGARMKAGIKRYNILTEKTGLLSNVLTDFRVNVASCVLCPGLC